VDELVPLGFTTSALASIPRLLILYIKLKIDQRGELQLQPQGYAINGYAACWQNKDLSACLSPSSPLPYQLQLLC